MRICIQHARVILPDRILENHSVLVWGGRILDVFPGGDAALPPDTQVVDADGLWLGPGFVDIHCHGGGGSWVHENLPAAASHHLAHGTTTMLATTLILPTFRELLDAVTSLAEHCRRKTCPAVLGIHMEGPYLNPKHGAFREMSRLPNREEYLALLQAGEGFIRTWTLAPELPGTREMVHELQQSAGGSLLFAVGHSEAEAEEIRRLISSGLRIATHCTNATGCSVNPTRLVGTREFGVDETVWLDDDLYAEVIVDRRGLHVRPDMLKLILKVKGLDRVVLITDATEARGTPPPGAGGDGVEDVCFNNAGELAGSALTMDVACSNVLAQTELGLAEVFRLASTNPASALGLSHRLGRIAPGLDANLLLFSLDAQRQIRLKQVMLEGVFETP